MQQSEKQTSGLLLLLLKNTDHTVLQNWFRVMNTASYVFVVCYLYYRNNVKLQILLIIIEWRDVINQ